MQGQTPELVTIGLLVQGRKMLTVTLQNLPNLIAKGPRLQLEGQVLEMEAPMREGICLFPFRLISGPLNVIHRHSLESASDWGIVVNPACAV
jgi:hypothetical protein